MVPRGVGTKPEYFEDSLAINTTNTYEISNGVVWVTWTGGTYNYLCGVCLVIVDGVATPKDPANNSSYTSKMSYSYANGVLNVSYISQAYSSTVTVHVYKYD